MKRHQQQGAAILMAMVTVSVVAAVAVAAIAQRWTQVEVERAERTRAQAYWLLQGALDWSRLILRQDAQSAAHVDHAGEPWAIALQPAKVGDFLQTAAGASHADASVDTAQATLSGGLQDQQGKLNLYQLLLLSPQSTSYGSVQRLFDRLGLPASDYQLLERGLHAAHDTQRGGQRPLMPQRLEDIAWLGVSASTIAALQPHAWLHAAATAINLNTANATVVWAASQMDWSQAQALVAARSERHFRSLEDVRQRVEGVVLPDGVFAVRSDYFVATGTARIDELGVAMQAQLQRVQTQVHALHVQTQGVMLP